MNRLVILRRMSTKVGRDLPANAMKPAFGAPDLAAAKAYKETMLNTEAHASRTSDMWFKISMWVALPAILGAAYHTYFVEKEHAEHRKHLAHVPDEDWPRDNEFMNIRNKPFFWGDGDKTLFWNPTVNRNIKHDD